MPEVSKLVPETASARAEGTGRFGAAVGPRFFIGLILGLVWLGPAWWDLRFIYAMALWDALVLLAWYADWRRLPRPQDLTVTRVWFEPLSQGNESAVADVPKEQPRAVDPLVSRVPSDQYAVFFPSFDAMVASITELAEKDRRLIADMAQRMPDAGSEAQRHKDAAAAARAPR